MTSKIIYQGDLRTQAIHIRSGNNIITDAPTDNNGKGEYFSPTDLLAASLGSCMLTIIGIYSIKNDLDIKGASAEITKVMTNNPRRVETIRVNLDFSGLNLSSKTQNVFKRLAENCPVALSLNKEIKQALNLKFKSENPGEDN